MAKNSTKEHTRERIINSAKKLFAKQGYQKTTIVDISKRAGLFEAALYEYFQGKVDLLQTQPSMNPKKMNAVLLEVIDYKWKEFENR